MRGFLLFTTYYVPWGMITRVHYVPESWGPDTGMLAEVLEASLTVELHVSWEGMCALYC